MQAVQALPASFRSSLRPVSTSNGAGSRAAGSRGPWSSAELATRPVRKGPPKPKENAPDSRKTRTGNHRIPGEGSGVKCSTLCFRANAMPRLGLGERGKGESYFIVHTLYCTVSSRIL